MSPNDNERRRSTSRILGFAGVVALVAAAVYSGFTARVPPVPHLVDIPWPLILVAFALVETFTIHIEFRQDAHTFSLSELPLVLGLVFCDPGTLILARLAGGFIAIGLVRRQSYEKLAFNTALFGLEVVAALAIYGAAMAVFPQAAGFRWIAVYLATLGVAATSAGAITAVIALASGERSVASFRRTLFAGAGSAIATTSLALVAVELIEHDTASIWLIAVMASILFLIYRGYAALHQRYANLQRLYEFTGALARSSEVEAAVRSSLTRARDLMRAGVAELYLFDEPGTGICVASSPDGGVVTRPFERVAGDDWVWQCVAGDGKPVLLGQSTRDPAARRYLDERGWKDLMLAPLVHGGQVIGALLVRDRLGVVSSFDDEDRKVFETLANHACVSIQNSRLIDRLRDEVASKQHQALHDMLTGLGNRRLFGERTEQALADAERDGAMVAVLLLDLNRFKDVNDSLGHHCGDELLRQVGARLSGALPAPASVCRLGGDEFAVLLPRIASATEAVEAAARIKAVLDAPFEVQDLALGVGAAIGIALSPQHGRDAATLLRHADVAMYQSKESHTLELYDADRDQASARRLALAVELREAIETGALDVHFQPKASLANGMPVGAEALCRWERPGHGYVSPEEFIPLAENVGLMRPLTMLVLRRAMTRAASWRDAGHSLGISVNLSARSIMDVALPEEIARLLAETGLDPSLLTLEITESQVVSDPSRTIRVLERLKALGVTLSIDDFGTGYSSLSYLQRLPVDEIKIDKSFVIGMASDPGNASIVRSVIDLARNLGMQIVAEGVEDRAAWDLLASLGCTVAQGYYVARPLPGPMFDRWLSERRPLEPPLWDNVAVLPAGRTG